MPVSNLHLEKAPCATAHQSLSSDDHANLAPVAGKAREEREAGL